MTSDLDQFDQPLRRFRAHWSAAAVSLVGAAVVQFAWPVVLSRPVFDSWWPLDAALVVAASGYLLATAVLHARAARWRPNELVPRLWLLLRGLLANVTIGACVLGILIQGPQTSTLRAGLWIVPPTLLAAAIASAAVILLTLGDGWRRRPSEIPPPDAPSGWAKTDLLHMALGIALLVAIVALETVEPQIKPWESPPPALRQP